MKGVKGEIIAGRYEVGEQVGSGGFGTVYAGRQINLNRDVAIKVMRQGPEGSAVSRERFRREAVLSSGFSHPNIVTYHDFVIDDDGDMILVMEFLRGVTLDNVIAQEEHLEIGRAARIVAEVASGLAECHRAGIVHRDIKPSNIFLLDRNTPRERAKIIDFGILWAMPDPAVEIEGLTRANAFIGTPEYVAPEVLIGAYPDGRTDQYALAMVALRAMTGELPFKSSKGPALLDRIAGRPPVLGSARLAGTPAVRGVLYKALSPEPGDRFADMDEFGRAMASAAGVVPGMGTFPMPTPGVFDADSACADDTVVEFRTRNGAESPAQPVVPVNSKRKVKAVAAFLTVAVCAVFAGVALTWGMNGWDSASLAASGGPVSSSAVIDAVAVGPKSSGTVATDSSESNGTADAVAPESPGTVATDSPESPGVVDTGVPAAADKVESRSPASPARQPGKSAVGATSVRKQQVSPVASSAPESVGAPAVALESQPSVVAASVPEYGYLVVNVRPYADVWLGGKLIKRTPIDPPGYPLLPGRYTFEFRNPQLGVETRSVDIVAGKQTRVLFNMKAE